MASAAAPLSSTVNFHLYEEPRGVEHRLFPNRVIILLPADDHFFSITAGLPFRPPLPNPPAVLECRKLDDGTYYKLAARVACTPPQAGAASATEHPSFPFLYPSLQNYASRLPLLSRTPCKEGDFPLYRGEMVKRDDHLVITSSDGNEIILEPNSCLVVVSYLQNSISDEAPLIHCLDPFQFMDYLYTNPGVCHDRLARIFSNAVAAWLKANPGIHTNRGLRAAILSNLIPARTTENQPPDFRAIVFADGTFQRALPPEAHRRGCPFTLKLTRVRRPSLYLMLFLDSRGKVCPLFFEVDPEKGVKGNYPGAILNREGDNIGMRKVRVHDSYAQLACDILKKNDRLAPLILLLRNWKESQRSKTPTLFALPHFFITYPIPRVEGQARSLGVWLDEPLSLNRHLDKCPGYRISDRRRLLLYMKQLLQALLLLHQNGWVHGNIQLGTIYTTGHEALLGGFDNILKVDPASSYPFRKDVAALGCCFYTMFTGNRKVVIDEVLRREDTRASFKTKHAIEGVSNRDTLEYLINSLLPNSNLEYPPLEELLRITVQLYQKYSDAAKASDTHRRNYGTIGSPPPKPTPSRSGAGAAGFLAELSGASGTPQERQGLLTPDSDGSFASAHSGE